MLKSHKVEKVEELKGSKVEKAEMMKSGHTKKFSIPVITSAVGIILVIVFILALATGNRSLATVFLTPDQDGYRYYLKGEYEKAAESFIDPMWKGIALFKKGDFKEAASIFAGYDTAEAAFNQGNALVMQGKYEEAVKRYKRALDLKPGWEDAAVNRDIAVARAEMLRTKGGDMTGGEMGADEITFSEEEAPSSSGEEQIDGEQELSEEEMRAIWLRQVQTKPGDFLRAKFAYQYTIGTSKDKLENSE
jgi:Ca-activated chloride channel family protein